MSGIADRVDTTGLHALGGFSFPVFASPEAVTEACAVAARCQRALDWLAASSVSDRRSR